MILIFHVFHSNFFYPIHSYHSEVEVSKCNSTTYTAQDTVPENTIVVPMVPIRVPWCYCKMIAYYGDNIELGKLKA